MFIELQFSDTSRCNCSLNGFEIFFFVSIGFFRHRMGHLRRESIVYCVSAGCFCFSRYVYLLFIGEWKPLRRTWHPIFSVVIFIRHECGIRKPKAGQGWFFVSSPRTGNYHLYTLIYFFPVPVALSKILAGDLCSASIPCQQCCTFRCSCFFEPLQKMFMFIKHWNHQRKITTENNCSNASYCFVSAQFCFRLWDETLPLNEPVYHRGENINNAWAWSSFYRDFYEQVFRGRNRQKIYYFRLGF